MGMSVLSPRFKLALSVVLLSVTLLGLWLMLTPAGELVRFRNSLRARVGAPSDFAWTPSNIPPGFLYEQSRPPVLFETIGRQVDARGETSLDTMKLIVAHLRARPKVTGPIRSTSDVAYQEIVNNGRGYCADYTQAFTALAHGASLPVREWGLSFDGYGADGHAFSEVFDTATNRWVFVDPMNAFFVREKQTEQALSVLEFRRHLLSPGGFEDILIVPIGSASFFRMPDPPLTTMLLAQTISTCLLETMYFRTTIIFSCARFAGRVRWNNLQQ
jgi:transglutaminase-like putative cysteine protease